MSDAATEWGELFGMKLRGDYKDAQTGQPLREDLVRKARVEEMQYVEKRRVWDKVPRSVAKGLGIRPISTKWVDVNKGDDDNEKYRSRLVAREFRLPGEDSAFAPTPPLESLRLVMSLAVSDVPGAPKRIREARSKRRTQISCVDISRAYFSAQIDDKLGPMFVELPAEDPDSENMVGKLNVHMYGTRRAAGGWWYEYSSTLRELGFLIGSASACVFVIQNVILFAVSMVMTSQVPVPRRIWIGL